MKSKIISAVAALLLLACMIPLQGCYDVDGPGWGGGYSGYPAYSYGPSWYGPSYAYGYGHPWYHDGYWGQGHGWDGHDWAHEGGFHGGHVDFARSGHGGGFAHSEGGHGGRAVAHSGGHDDGHHHG